jgi:hypothetical protein
MACPGSRKQPRAPTHKWWVRSGSKAAAKARRKQGSKAIGPGLRGSTACA